LAYHFEHSLSSYQTNIHVILTIHYRFYSLTVLKNHLYLIIGFHLAIIHFPMKLSHPNRVSFYQSEHLSLSDADHNPIDIKLFQIALFQQLT